MINERICAKGIEAHVGLRFSGDDLACLARRGQKEAHATGIVSLVESHQRSGAPYRAYEREFLGCNGMPHLETVYVGAGLSVSTSETAMGHLEPFVQECIDAKNAKVARYRAALPRCEVWLLLVTNYFRIAVWGAVIQGHVYQSAFDRTFCLDPDSRMRRVAELKTKALLSDNLVSTAATIASPHRDGACVSR